MKKDDEETIKQQYQAIKKQKKKENWGKAISFFTHLSLKSAIILIVIILIAGGAGFGLKSWFTTQSNTTKLGFENIGELATQSANCTTVNVSDESQKLFGVEIPFTQSKYIYSYDTEIKAGLDFNEVTWEKNSNDKIITIYLPKIKVLSAETDLDSFKVYHDSESIFTHISLKKNNQALKNMKKTAKDDAIANGLLKKARSNAKIVLKGFFSKQFDETEWKYVFKNK